MSQRLFSDISDVLARKAQGRRERARLPFAEKLAILDRLRETAEQMKRARVSRSARPVKAVAGSKD
jgi:hypothetical protein